MGEGGNNMKITKTITIDLSKRTTPEMLYAKQGDEGSRFVQITLTEDGNPYLPPEGAGATLRCRKSDGKAVINPAVINSDGTITVELTQQVLAAAGPVQADVSLNGAAGEILSSLSFLIWAEPAPGGDETASSNEFLELQKLVQEGRRGFVGIASLEQTQVSDLSGGSNVITFTLTDGSVSTVVVKNGETPVRGVDYWTDADIAGIKAYVDEAILGGAW